MGLGMGLAASLAGLTTEGATPAGLGLAPQHIGTAIHDLRVGGWWRHWDLRPEVVLPLLLLGGLYSLGWWRLRQRGGLRGSGPWRLLAYWLGLALIAVALLSGVDPLGEQLFLMHMIQHLLLTMLAAPLLMLADPLPCLVWGLPGSLRRVATRPLRRGAWLRRVVTWLGPPQVALVLYIGVFWGWHAPAAYELALTNALAHDLEHLSFFGTAMLFWWHVVGAAPRLHGALHYGKRILLLLVAFVQNEVLAVAISFAGEPIYAWYAAQPRTQGLSVMDDQMIGGAIMWIPGGMMYGLAVILLIAAMLEAETRQVAARRGAPVDWAAGARL